MKAKPTPVIGNWTIERKKPRSLVWNLLLIPVALAGLIAGIVLTRMLLKTDYGLAVFFLTLFALYVLVRRLYQLLWSSSPSHTFRRSHQSATGEVVRRAVKEERDKYGHKSYKYFLTVQFDTDGGRARLKAQVGRGIHDQFIAGSRIEVRYATEDPSVALLQGERLM